MISAIYQNIATVYSSLQQFYTSLPSTFLQRSCFGLTIYVSLHGCNVPNLKSQYNYVIPYLMSHHLYLTI
jgi:hypothetical protein